MIEGIVQVFFKFWSSRKVLFAAVSLVILVVLGYGITRVHVSQDIYSILPKGEQFEKLNKLSSGNEFNNKVFFLLNTEQNSDENDAHALLENAKKSILQHCDSCFSEFTTSKENIEEDVYAYYYKNFPVLIDTHYYSFIDDKIRPENIQPAIKATYRQLISPGSGFIKKYVLNDPVYVTEKFFKILDQAHTNSQIKVKDGLIYSQDGQGVLLYATLKDQTTTTNEATYHALEDFKSEWNSNHPNVQIDYFGTFQIAAENSIQVKKDTQLTLFISVTLILLILVFYYRKITVPLYFILPTLFGGLFAIGIIGYIHPEVSGLSLATGAVLFGIGLDYSFHFFTHYAHVKSLEQNIKEIAAPLLTGSFTTILAFSSLMFANSVILHDFGLFATLALTGASLFTVFVLPLILTFTGFKASNVNRNKHLFHFPALSNRFLPYISILVVLITGVTLYFSGKITFDSDLSNLSYHKESLKDKEEKFVGIHPDHATRVYLFSSGKNMEESSVNNFRLYQKLQQLKAANEIETYISTGDFLIPESVQKVRLKRWKSYWNLHASGIIPVMDSTAQSLGFNPEAFSGFKSWLNKEETSPLDSSLLKKLELKSLLKKDKEGNILLISSIVVNKTKKEAVKAKLEALPGVQVFDRLDMTNSLVEMVKADFNYLLYASFFIVFVTLLVIYGRIELMLLSITPMILGWIWILGFAAILDIQFNFVNIVIATFIFGLGDDFSIFVTDGLLTKYKYGKNSLKSYREAIILSAISTVIGTGVLIFAKHPAIHSIALISVLGISLILVISLVVQPVVFRFFVQSRINKKRVPVTFTSLAFSVFSFLLFVIACFTSTLLLPFIVILPVPGKTK